MKVVRTTGLPVKMWDSETEQGAVDQALDASRLPFVFKHVALMPDAHQGYGVPIGSVLATNQVIIPNAVGVDIGCGMAAIQTDFQSSDMNEIMIKEWMKDVRATIPVGFNKHKEAQDSNVFSNVPDIEVLQRELSNARLSLGTLGGGNHFIELQEGQDGYVWIMIHSGSRNPGLKVAKEYHDMAVKLCEKWSSDIPNKDLSFLPMDELGAEYYEAMTWCMDYALENRSLMIGRAWEALNAGTGAKIRDEVNIHHNYAGFEHHFGKNVIVHRKGATKASHGLRGIIPGSMGSSSYITYGLGSPESFESCSHGAGRRMSRTEAKKVLDLEAQQEIMGRIVHGLRSTKNLDEAPGAYKDIDTVMANQEDLTQVINKLTPLASIKG